MTKKHLKIAEFHVMFEEHGMTCGISFDDEFIDQDDDLKSTLVVAMHSALTDFMEVGMVVDTREEFIMHDEERATEDAANFLDRCVKKQGGRLH